MVLIVYFLFVGCVEKKQEKIVPSSIKNEKIKKINLFDSEKKLIIGAEDDWIPYSRSDGTGMSKPNTHPKT